jgi:hypothetical protein
MSLSALKHSIAQGKSGLTLSFTVEVTRVSAQLLQSQACSLPAWFQTPGPRRKRRRMPLVSRWGRSWLCSVRLRARRPLRLRYLLIAVYPPPSALTVRFGLLRFQ